MCKCLAEFHKRYFITIREGEGKEEEVWRKTTFREFGNVSGAVPDSLAPGPVTISIFIVLAETSKRPRFAHGSLRFVEVAATAVCWVVEGVEPGAGGVLTGRMDGIHVRGGKDSGCWSTATEPLVYFKLVRPPTISSHKPP